MKAIQKELGESDDAAGGSRRAPQESRRVGDVRRSEKGVRARAEAAREDDSCFGRIHGFAHVPGMDDLAAMEQDLRHRRRRIDIAKAQEILDEDHYDLEKVKERILDYLAVKKAPARHEGADPLLRRASGRGQDFAREVDRSRAGPQIRAHLAGRDARRGGNPRPPAHLHRRVAGPDHPRAFAEPRRRIPSSCWTRWTSSAAISAAIRQRR